MVDIIASLVIAGIVIAAILYIRNQKKKGVKCIGCSSGSCSGNCHCSSAVGSSGKKDPLSDEAIRKLKKKLG